MTRYGSDDPFFRELDEKTRESHLQHLTGKAMDSEDIEIINNYIKDFTERLDEGWPDELETAFNRLRHVCRQRDIAILDGAKILMECGDVKTQLAEAEAFIVILRAENARLRWAVERALDIHRNDPRTGGDSTLPFTKVQSLRSWADWATKARAALACGGE